MAADIERLLTVYLETALEVRVVAELPADLTAPETLPIVQVEEAPGPGWTIPTLDVCDVDVDVYAVGRQESRQLAEQVRALVMAMTGLMFDDGLTVVSKVETQRKPTLLPYDDSDIRRMGGAYRYTLHTRA
jgi:hypothetical protein